MKLEKPVNPNYAATVVEIAHLRELEGCDNVVGAVIFGMQAIVGKNTKEGDIGLFFPAETQLSEEFAKLNNLHRHTDRNADPTQKGYFEDNRRVKAMKFRGHRSDAFFIPLDSLSYIKGSGDLAIGDTFDKIGEHEICKKYVVKEPGVNRGPSAKVRRVDVKLFPTHIDTENWWRNERRIPSEAHVVVTQKLHGTSGRWGKVPVERTLSWKDKLAQRFGIEVSKTKHQLVSGSRMVVKSIDGTLEEGKQNFHLDDLWTRWGERLHDLIPENFIVYGELIGWTADQTPIQKNYTYDMYPGSSELYVYRVAVVTPQGITVDLSWPQVKEFCWERDLKHVPELFTARKDDFANMVDGLMDKRYVDDGFWNAVQLSNHTSVDEGLCIRYDGPQGIFILKAKSPIFLQHETAILDEGIEDIESEESV